MISFEMDDYIKSNQQTQVWFTWSDFLSTVADEHSRPWTEPGTSGLEKTAPPGELEFSSRSN